MSPHTARCGQSMWAMHGPPLRCSSSARWRGPICWWKSKPSPLRPEPMARYDLVLRGGRVIDGSGAPSLTADVAITGDRVAAVERLPLGSGRAEIDVAGLAVAPGFIDVHTHDDRALLSRPDMAPKVSQGVTTVITGNCGDNSATTE